eukprot:TRINITY_DN5102_c0_g1_i1.p1 TRINITY_DN5102_c0_g1~~TRINITY_DN5102_c0_g1_i1.p1  ORF type:complete len:210 (-),score=79.16 TRINITY_DN5102_c0_g1_i1:218-787(-)
MSSQESNLIISENKLYVSYSIIHNTVKKLADQVRESDHQPDIIVAIGTGGLIPGRILKTYLQKPLFFVTINLYDEETNLPRERPRIIQWINDVAQIQGKHVLIVDEVDDTRMTLEFCANELQSQGAASVSWFVIFNKNKPKRGSIPAYLNHFYIGHEIGDHWIRFPWDATNLEEHEQKAHGIVPASSSS